MQNIRLQVWQALLILLVAGLCHRIGVFLVYEELFLNQVKLNSNFLGMQYMSPEALGQHLGKALWVMQLTPPFPNLLIATGIKLFGFPYGLASFLVITQGVISTICSCLVFLCLVRLKVNVIASLAFALLFLFSTDLLLMEYSVLGQAIHESLAMLLLTLCFYLQLLARGAENPKHKNIFYLLTGLILGLLVLSRSYFFIFPLLFLILLALQKAPLKKLLLVIIPVVILQGGWSMKNYIVHDYFSLQTSTFSGMNLEHALSRTGHYDDFYPYVQQNDEHCPDWLQNATDEMGLTFFWVSTLLEYVPENITRAEVEKIEMLGGNNKDFLNGQVIKAVSDCYRKAWFGFAISHPGIIFDVFQQSFRRFWQPMRHYSRLYISFFYPRQRLEFLGDPATHPRDENSSIHDIYIMQASLAKAAKDKQPVEKTEIIPANTGTFSLTSILILYLSFITINLVLPLLLVYCLTSKQYETGKNLLLFLLVYLYVTGLTSIGEFGENTRFRLTIEPLIWVFTVYTWHQLWLMIRKPIGGTDEEVQP